MTLTRDEENRWAITAEAAQIDLVPLRRNRGIGKGRPVTFDILADQIFVGDGIWLSGHVSGSKLGAGGGEASFSGNLIYDKRPDYRKRASAQLRKGRGFRERRRGDRWSRDNADLQCRVMAKCRN